MRYVNVAFVTIDFATLLYTYISRFSVNHHYQRMRKSRKAAAINFIPQPFFILLFNFSHKWPTFAFTAESGYTLGFPRKIAHSGLHAETGGFTIVQPRWVALFSLQFGDAAFFALRSVFSVCTRRGGITILGALCAFSKRPVLALLNRLQRIWTI